MPLTDKGKAAFSKWQSSNAANSNLFESTPLLDSDIPAKGQRTHALPSMEAVHHALSSDPKKTAENYAAANGEPVFDPVSKAHQALTQSQTLKSAPTLSEILKDPEQSPFFLKDADRISALESIVRGVVSDPIRQAVSDAVGVVGGTVRGTAKLTDISNRRFLDQGKAYIRSGGADAILTNPRVMERLGLDAVDPADEGALSEARERYIADMMAESSPRRELTAGVNKRMEEFAAYSDQVAESIAVPADRRTIIDEIAGATGQMGLQIVLGVVASPALMAQLYAQGAGDMTKRARDQQARIDANAESAEGIGDDTAVEFRPEVERGIEIAGAVTSITNRLGLEPLLRKLPHMRKRVHQSIQSLLLGVGSEFSTEVLENVLLNKVEKSTINPDVEVFQWSALREGAVAGGARGIIEAGLGLAFRKTRRAQQSVQENAQIDELIKASAESDVSTLSPTAFRNYLQSVQDDGPRIREVLVDIKAVRAAVSESASPEAAERALRNNPLFAQVEAALETDDAQGNDSPIVAIPIQDFLTHAPRDQAFLELVRPSLRLTDGALTQAELATEKTFEDRLVEIAQQLNQGVATNQESQAFAEQLVEQLVATGQLSRADAETSTDVAAALVQSVARSAGKSQAEIIQEMGLRVVGPETTQLPAGVTLAQDPAFAEAFGQSTLVDAQGEPQLYAVPDAEALDSISEAIDGGPGTLVFTPVTPDEAPPGATALRAENPLTVPEVNAGTLSPGFIDQARFAGYDSITDGNRVVVLDPSQLVGRPRAVQPVTLTPEATADRSFQQAPVIDKTTVEANLSVATGRIPGLANLHAKANAGDRQAASVLSYVARDALAYLTSGLKTVRIDYQNTTGLYFGDLEPSLGVKVSFDYTEGPAVRAALGKIAENFRQQEVHVRTDAEPGTEFGHVYSDKSYNTMAYVFQLEADLPRSEIEKIVNDAGLAGFTVGDKQLTTYFVGDPDSDTDQQDFINAAENAGAALGGKVSRVRKTVQRLYQYGEDPDAGIGRIPYSTLRGNLRIAPKSAAVHKYNPTATRIAGYHRGLTVNPANQSTVITPEQRSFQERVAAVYAGLPVNDLADPNTARAYRELASEMVEQFSALPASVEFWRGKGEPYANSAAMRKDVRENNHLWIYPTEPGKFGPPDADFTGHPLLAETEFTDTNGDPMVVNDLLRAVHDYYAHTMMSVEFGAKGEEAAFRNHMAMTASPWAQWALATETRGQNSWVNFGPQAKGIPARDRPFADQKAALLPLEMVLTNDEDVDANLRELAAELGLPVPEPRVTVSTALPNVYDPVTSEAKSEVAFLSDKQIASAAATMKGYDGAPRMKERKPDKVLEKIINHLVDNLLFLHDQFPAEHRDRATKWYDGAREISDRMAAKYNMTPRQSAGILAALSPQLDWFINVSLGYRVADFMAIVRDTDMAFTKEMRVFAESLTGYAKDEHRLVLDAMIGKRWSDMSAAEKPFMLRIWDEMFNEKAYPVVSPEGNFMSPALTNKKGTEKIHWGSNREIGKAISIAEDGSFRNVSIQVGNKHKVRNFFNNIIAPMSDGGFATMDTHAVAAAWLVSTGGKGEEVLHNFGSGKGGMVADVTTGIGGTYPIYLEAYQRAAAKRGILPRQMQSITWEAVRLLFPDDTKTKAQQKAVRDVWKEHKSGNITAEQARERIFNAAGGITLPAWAISDARPDERFGDAAFGPKLSGDGVPTGVAVGPQRGGTTAGTDRDGQTPGRTFRQEARGDVTFTDAGALVRMTEAADLSTFLHEFGHVSLDLYARLAAAPDATDAIKSDAAAIAKFLGAESLNELTVEQHEQFARAFELYLFEGKAPSLELVSPFRKISSWLKAIYKRMTTLNVELDWEIRRVFDRMLATDEQIKEATDAENMAVQFWTDEDALKAGLTEAEAAKYRSDVEETIAGGEEKLRQQVMAVLKKQRDGFYKAELAAALESATVEVRNRREYRAADWLRSGMPTGPDLGGLFVSPDEIAAGAGLQKIKFGTDYIRGMFGGSIPPKLRGMTSPDSKFSPDDVAEIFGYESGEELVADLLTLRPINDVAKELAAAQVESDHGDLLNDTDALELAATEAVTSEARGRVILAELRALTRSAGQAERMRRTAQVKAAASRIIALKTVQELRPYLYRRAELKAAQEAARLQEEGDLVGAADAKEQQLLQHHLLREATKAQADASKIRTRLRRVQTRTYSRTQVNPEYVERAKATLQLLEFRKMTAAIRAELQGIRDWLQGQVDNPLEDAPIPQFAVDEALFLAPRHYTEMTLEELRGVDALVTSILHAGRSASEVERAAFKADMERAAAAIDASNQRPIEEIRDPNRLQKVGQFFRSFAVGNLKFEHLVRDLDGFLDLGTMWRLLVEPLATAHGRELDLQEEASESFQEIIGTHKGMFTDIPGRRGAIKFELDDNRTMNLSYGARIALAANWGNAGNRDAVLGQTGSAAMTEADVEKVLATLTKSDWELVQKLWQRIDSYWDQIASLERRQTGVVPAKVQPTSFTVTTADGETLNIPGSYYPLMKDPSKDAKAHSKLVQEQAEEAMQRGGATRAATRHGHTIERTNFGGMTVNLDIGAGFDHIERVIHDLTHREAVQKVDRVLRNKLVREAIVRKIGVEGYRELNDVLVTVAAGQVMAEGMTGLDRALRWTRMGRTYAGLGLNLKSAISQVFGAGNTVAQFNRRDVILGMYEFMRNPVGLTKQIYEVSTVMRNRARTKNRDVSQALSELRDKTVLTRLRRLSFAPMTAIDMVVSLPTWWIAYKSKLEAGESDADAAKFADRTVLRTQQSSILMDLSRFERGSEAYKQFTVFYSAFNALYNLTAERTKRYRRGDISFSEFSTGLFWSIAFPAIAETILFGKLYDILIDDEEDDEAKIIKLMKGLANDVGKQASAMLPFVRDIVSAWNYGRASSLPVQDILSAPARLAVQVEQGELDQAAITAAIDVTGQAFHLPGTAQANRMIRYMYQAAEAPIEDFNPYRFLVTGPVRPQ